eukprot:234644-Chlamydomonas_euryale.AAC.7
MRLRQRVLQQQCGSPHLGAVQNSRSAPLHPRRTHAMPPPQPHAITPLSNIVSDLYRQRVMRPAPAGTTAADSNCAALSDILVRFRQHWSLSHTVCTSLHTNADSARALVVKGLHVHWCCKVVKRFA